jgi:serine/threonine-protein kinase
MNNPADPSPILTTIHPGDQIGKYRIEMQIGSGGGAIVWRGIDPLLNKIVAIKQLAPSTLDMDTHAARQHFANEAKLGRELSEKDPRHLVQVLEYISETRGLFIVMEYVNGSSLETILRKLASPMPPKQALGIMAATAMGLQHLHDNGVIHRDLKPANILMPNNGGLKICDFGLASLIGDMDTMAAGSVRYMAPELTSGESVDGRADLYSLGMIAYEMIAGRNNFEQAFRFVLKDQRNQALRWMKWHANQRAKATPLKELVPGIEPTLSDLVERLMAKDPTQRITSGNELVEAIKVHFANGADKADASQIPQSAPGQTQGSAAGHQVLTGNAATNIAPDQPTAMLPKKSKLPYYLAAVIVVLCGVLVVLVMQKNNDTQNQEMQRVANAHAAYKAALQRFKEKEYEQASNLFAELIQEWPATSDLGRKSKGYQLLSEARIYENNKAYDAAVKALMDADESGAFDNEQREKLRVQIRETQRKAAFANQVSKIEQLLADKQYDLARQQLIEQNSYSPTEDEKKVLDEMGTRLSAMQDQSVISGILDEARQLVETSRRDEAIAMLEEKQLRLSNHLINQRINELKRERDYDQALLDARTAQRNNQLSQAIDLYSRAQQIKEDPAIEQQINQLRAQIAFQSGQERERAGDLRGATTQYTRALSFADMPQARRAIERINNATERDTLIAAGDDALATRNYSTAIEHYKNAMKMGRDASLRQKLASAELEQHFQAGRRALDQANLDVARAELTAASRITPDDSRIAQALKELDTLAAYTTERDAGDKARKQGDYGAAKMAYYRAKKIIDNEEIRKRFDDTEYEHLLARAKHQISIRQFEQARLNLLQAAKIHDTPETRKLLEQVGKEE